MKLGNSNTTLVKVKLIFVQMVIIGIVNSNTTLVKVKFRYLFNFSCFISIQIQLLLKLNLEYRIEDLESTKAFKYNSC